MISKNLLAQKYHGLSQEELNRKIKNEFLDLKVLSEIADENELLETIESSLLSDSYFQYEVFDILKAYLIIEPITELEVLMKAVLRIYLKGDNPFPNIKDRKGKKITKKKFIQIAYYFIKTQSVNKTAKMLNISPKSVRNVISEDVREHVRNNDEDTVNAIQCMIDKYHYPDLDKDFIKDLTRVDKK
jgi:hypothetical protein